MEPLSLATTFATIVGLICNFKQERKDIKEASRQQFIDWLQEHRHEEIEKYIRENSALSQSIDSLLRQNHDQLIKKLNYVEDMVSSLLSRVEGFDNIVQAINPDFNLSDQAIDILRQLVNSGANDFRKLFEVGRPEPMFQLSHGGKLKITESRFVNDDLNTLVKLDLLNLSYISQGDEVYAITRKAQKLIDMINENK